MSVPQYGLNKHADALSAGINNTGFKEISVVTAADASHTLSAADGGTIWINCALASGAVIKLPSASLANVGLKFKIVYPVAMAAASKIQLKDADPAVFVGVLEVQRCGPVAGVDDAVAVNRVVMVTTAALAEKSIELDENNESFGGSEGSIIELEYVSPTAVFVSGHLNYSVATTDVDAVQSTSFTATGY